MILGLEFGARVFLLALSYLAPGWLLLRWAGLRRCFAGAFLLSSACIYLAAISLGFLGVRLSLHSVGLVLAGLGLALCLLPACTSDGNIALPLTEEVPGRKWMWGFLAATMTLFVWRAFAQPLTGPDTAFRWNYLALEIGRTGGFSFYPPVTLQDFEQYFYADGFSPFVALQYWWTYAVFGHAWPVLTGFVVTALFSSALIFAFQLAAARGGASAGLLATTCIASSGLVFWAFHIGQETGWIAVSLLGTAWCWIAGPKPASTSQAIIAALALLPAVVAREYGFAFVGAGVLLAWHCGASRQMVIAVAMAILVLAAPWYGYTWLRCGNPFYSLSPFGLFPGNPTVSGLLASYSSAFAIQHQRLGLLSYRALDLALNSPLILFVSGVAIARSRRHLAVFGVVALLCVLWWTAAAYTSGGLHLANRLLAPAAIWIAIVGAIEWPRRLRAAFVLPLFCTWSLYVNAAPPHGVRFVLPGTWWRELTTIRHLPAPTPLLTTSAAIGPHERILSDDAYLHAQQRAAGLSQAIVPYWAPEVRFLFSPGITAGDAARRLRALDIAAVQEVVAPSRNLKFWQSHRFFRDILTSWPLVENTAGIKLRRVPVPPAPGNSSTAHPKGE